MATRSTIAIELENGSVKQVYCHWDGYPSHNGNILLNHYSDPVLAEELISNGDISVLGKVIGEKHDFSDTNNGMTTYYGRDRGETGVDYQVFPSFESYVKRHQYEDYEYILRNDGVWYMSSGKAYRELTLHV